MCTRACDLGFACVSGECLRDGETAAIGAIDRLGIYGSRRLVVAPVFVARLGPGDARAETAPLATLARQRDAGAMLLLRFALDLPPGATIVEAHLLLDRATAVDVDPAPVVLRAARVVEPWDVRSISWGRAPRIEQEDALARTEVSDARLTVRLDVRPLVRRWRRHARDDQGIAVVADRTSASGVVFALADGAGAGEDAARLPPVRTPGPPPLFSASEPGDRGREERGTRGPRLELYVKP